eukprot:TRINITY_DN3585_c0_g1_i1.p1 TRINITY_DN3585_c0_g1~~TRINITY_DN3585_c0_g1_i1.p1  ORF type:complete len:221 (-),score=49.85 TRINITY_DN3585_c0_g1_i1:2-589(-)
MAAQRDPYAFKDASKFDPQRKDYGNALAFNAVWEDIEKGDRQTSPHHDSIPFIPRACPSRWFSTKWQVANVPRWIPRDVTCAHGNQVHRGIKFTTELISVEDDGDNEIILDVKKVVKDDEINGDILLLFLHGYEMMPSAWANVIAKVEKEFCVVFFQNRLLEYVSTGTRRGFTTEHLQNPIRVGRSSETAKAHRG